MIKRLLLCLCVFTFLSQANVFAQGTSNKDHNFKVAKNLETFSAIYKYLDLMYVDTLNADEVIGNGINAMLSSLDPYTVYYPEDKVKELDMMISGKYAGIGALIRYDLKLDNVIIDEPYENMPAAEAGLKKGDIILSVNDSSMYKKSTSYVSDHLRGDAGSTFLLKIKRPSTGKTMKFKLTRKAIQMPAVPYYGLQQNGIGYLDLNSFTVDCSKDVRKAFLEMKKDGMKSLVLDLRNNGGGSLQEAINIVNMFVPKGLVLVNTKGKLERANREYKTTVEPIDTLIPIVVLVNDETASASEITSGSLQDLDRAVILGTRTYGKGLVQAPMELPYNGNLKLTTSKYYIPSGRCIQAINYKHSRGGYLEHVPDSLTKVFHTANGRIVRDGGGINPDVKVLPDSLPNIAFYLANSGMDSTEVMTNWVLNYIKQHPTIGDPKSFIISDADYENFKSAVIKSGFKYDRQSEKVIKNLIDIAKFEGYYDDAKSEFAALEKKLQHNLAKELDHHKQTIKQVLTADLVAAYYYQRGAIANSLQFDKQWKEAVKLLENPQEYKKILMPKQHN
ncbi:S41 family peptidase [Prevotella pallens]|uniref:S41 family peptidase n=1 Tax=Prevotella pallens TaxID=60133 RepID=UPI001CADECE8|nr:S41 family peptidase [Prevotella pallens]MBF1470709.1 S41 family peptidase [Prevotella pallens]MBF1488792.1 S41 family peptidase [Prevotella pallens]MBF1497091.1 S41 family peptidase [Prevotella pallens]MBF1499984.1 S41 family peptidase [Prevotella pallens]